ncbi:MAG: glycine cleavage system protein R [Kiritimatiellia bacterium]
MIQQVVMTVLGPDRPGIVELLAEKIREHQGSWQESRLLHVQDQFAGIVEISLPAARRDDFDEALRSLQTEYGLLCQTRGSTAPKAEGKLVRLECIGQDRPGIVFAISDVFHDLNVNVESLDSSIQSAPMSGETLFCAKFQVRLPDQLDLQDLEQRLSVIGEELMLDLQIED